MQEYIDFSLGFMEYIEKNNQAIIVSQNENEYKFFQYSKESHYKITRPYNSNLLYSFDIYEKKLNEFIHVLKNILQYRDEAEIADKEVINRSIYSIQQSIGFALDALIDTPNRTRKLVGDIFEKLILTVLMYINIDCKSQVIKIPLEIKSSETMKFQHDLVITDNTKEPELTKLIGSIKTTSKDRLAKIFVDKLLYNKLTDSDVPHIAIFLHDVQRKKYKNQKKYGINSTFLSGHFKVYSVKLIPLDGVYYFDIRPNMVKDSINKKYIKTFDALLTKDLWNFIR